MRSSFKKIFDTITFPFRAFFLNEKDWASMSSLRTERFDYVAREAGEHTLDVGCGRHNRFIVEFLKNKGIGIDVYPYEGLTKEHIVEDITKFPFEDETFDTVTFIANVNHIPEPKRDIELAEAYRVLKPGGKIIITMAVAWAEVLTHKVVWFSDTVFKTNIDIDNERGMEEEEEYYLTSEEIISRMQTAGFKFDRRKRFGTQWFLNSLFIGVK